MTRHGYRPAETRHVNEGQGDLLVVGSIILAGYGFRTEPTGPRRDRRVRAGCRSSASNWSTRASTTSTPRSPCSTTPRSPTTRRRSATRRSAKLRELFPDAIEVASADAYVLGLNVVSDGLNVVLPAAATGFAEQLARPDSGRSASTCPSCSRAADPSNAAHWRYIRDHAWTSVRRIPTRRSHSTTATSPTTTRRCRWWRPAPRASWITDIEGRRYLDCLAAYSAVNFGHRNPEITATAHAQLDSGDAGQPRVPLRPARPVLRGAGRAVRQRHGAADEQRRRSRRKRHQGGPQVGHRRQGRARRTGQYRGGAQQLPRPHHHHHQLLRRRDGPPRLRPVHPGLPFGALR